LNQSHKFQQRLSSSNQALFVLILDDKDICAGSLSRNRSLAERFFVFLGLLRKRNKDDTKAGIIFSSWCGAGAEHPIYFFNF